MSNKIEQYRIMLFPFVETYSDEQFNRDINRVNYLDKGFIEMQTAYIKQKCLEKFGKEPVEIIIDNDFDALVKIERA